MVLVNGGFLHCTDEEILVNSFQKATKKKLARAISKKKSGERSRAILALLFGVYLSQPVHLSSCLSVYVCVHTKY